MTTALYEKNLEAAARVIARHQGIVGDSGGWLYRNGRHVVQGYRAYGKRLQAVGAIVPREVTDPASGRKVTRYAIAWDRVR